MRKIYVWKVEKVLQRICRDQTECQNPFTSWTEWPWSGWEISPVSAHSVSVFISLRCSVNISWLHNENPSLLMYAWSWGPCVFQAPLSNTNPSKTRMKYWKNSRSHFIEHESVSIWLSRTQNMVIEELSMFSRFRCDSACMARCFRISGMACVWCERGL